jgi:hypothetical protein
MYIQDTNVKVIGQYSDLNREISRLAQFHNESSPDCDYRLLAMFGFVRSQSGFVCHFCELPWNGDVIKSHPNCNLFNASDAKFNMCPANVPFSKSLFKHVSLLTTDYTRSEYLDTLTTEYKNFTDDEYLTTPLWMFLKLSIYTRNMSSENFFCECWSDDTVGISFTGNGYKPKDGTNWIQKIIE